MSSLDPLISGRWNGHTLWLQWNPVAESYRVEVAVRDSLEEEPRWMLIDKGETQRNWMAIPIWKHGAFVQARVARGDGPPWEEPEMARECIFRRSTCLFGFQAGPKRPLIYDRGSMFHCQVDGAACSYVTDDLIEVEKGEMMRATLRSLVSSGWSQLDHEGHFELRPGAGVRIWNLEPSVNDVEVTPREYTQLAVMERDGPVAVVKVPRNPNVR